MEVGDGDRYRCPVESCGCVTAVSSAPKMATTQNFIDPCGLEMERVEQ